MIHLRQIGIMALFAGSCLAQARTIAELKADILADAVQIHEQIATDFNTQSVEPKQRVVRAQKAVKDFEATSKDLYAQHEQARQRCLAMPSPVTSSRCLEAEDQNYIDAQKLFNEQLVELRKASGQAQQEVNNIGENLFHARETEILELARRNASALEGIKYLTEWSQLRWDRNSDGRMVSTVIGTLWGFDRDNSFYNDTSNVVLKGYLSGIDAETYAENGTEYVAWRTSSDVKHFKVIKKDFSSCNTHKVLMRIMNVYGAYRELPQAHVSNATYGFFADNYGDEIRYRAPQECSTFYLEAK